MPEPPWLTLTEAAARTGLPRETLRSRARHGLIPRRLGNRGEWLVQLPPEPNHGNSHGSDHGNSHDNHAPAYHPPAEIAELKDELRELREELNGVYEQLEAARVARARAEGELAAELRRSADLAAFLTETRADLAEARKPLWRRWLSR